MKKSKQQNADEYLQVGPFELARFGKVVTMRNNMSAEEHAEFMKLLVEHSEPIEKSINVLVNEIRELVTKCDPLKLLQYGYFRFVSSLIGIESEAQLDSKSVYIGRELEYIQSVIASMYYRYVPNDDDQSELYSLISDNIRKLYEAVQQYLIYFTATERSRKPDIAPELEKFIVESILAMFIRGERYPVYEISHLRALLTPHTDIFERTFDTTVESFIDGLASIQRSLSKGLHNSFQDLESLIVRFGQFVEENNFLASPDEAHEAFRSLISSDPMLKELQDGFAGKFFGYDLFDLSTLTNWPKKLQQKLSWKLGENTSFYSHEKYAGWPIIEMPIFQRPFIEIEGECYCFDYYNLFDNIYRIIQKLIFEENSSYKPIWSEKQMVATETMVADLFSKLLPGCKVFQSNYYPIHKSLKQCAENDILIMYDNHLFIVEVKAGSYTYTAPITDIQSHIRSLETLVGKADGQASRTVQYIKSSAKVKFYDEDKTEKFEMCFSDFESVTKFCVTLDNFNEFAAKAEKIGFLSLEDSTVVLSIDDLRVYSDYFESPSTFLHFLKQRKHSATIDKLALNDELDHLGMYIAHNLYPVMVEETDADRMFWVGYREELDKYFSNLFYNTTIEKPMQKIPTRMAEIIRFLDDSDLKRKSFLASFLLDFSTETREVFSATIDKCLEQKENNRMLIPSTFGEVRYSLFCHQFGVKSFTDSYARDYVLATILRNNEDSRLELHLYYDSVGVLKDIRFNNLTNDDIPQDRVAELKALGDKCARSRISSYKVQNGKNKIGRNEKCPCGSGLKYKKCCGN